MSGEVQRWPGWISQSDPSVCIPIERRGGRRRALHWNRSICLYPVPLKQSTNPPALFVLHAAGDTGDEKPSNVHYNQGWHISIIGWIFHFSATLWCLSVKKSVCLNWIFRLLYVNTHLFVFKINNKCSTKYFWLLDCAALPTALCWDRARSPAIRWLPGRANGTQRSRVRWSESNDNLYLPSSYLSFSLQDISIRVCTCLCVCARVSVHEWFPRAQN